MQEGSNTWPLRCALVGYHLNKMALCMGLATRRINTKGLCSISLSFMNDIDRAGHNPTKSKLWVLLFLCLPALGWQHGVDWSWSLLEVSLCTGGPRQQAMLRPSRRMCKIAPLWGLESLEGGGPSATARSSLMLAMGVLSRATTAPPSQVRHFLVHISISQLGP